MRNKKGALLFFAIGIMQICWLYAWASFTMTSIFHRPFPLPEAIGTFGLGALLTLLSLGRGWRVIYILTLHAFGIAFVILRIIYVTDVWPESFFNQTWILDLMKWQRDPMGWLLLAIALFWGMVFWIKGITFTRGPKTYRSIAAGFDLGIAAFLALMLIKLAILKKGGINIQDPLTVPLLFPFFTFGLLALGLARNRSDALKDYLPGFRGIGILLSFAGAILLFGTGLVSLFLPYLTAAAEVSYGVLKKGAEPLGPILISILRFLFMSGRIRLSGTAGESHSGWAGSTEAGWWDKFLEPILWGLGIFAGLILLAGVGFVVYFLMRWLFSRTSASKKKEAPWGQVLIWLAKIRALYTYYWGRMLIKIRALKNATVFYAQLLSWGRHSGLPLLLSETPLEYGLRLKKYFPTLRSEIDLIIEIFNMEVYGGIAHRDDQLSMVQLAWRRLRSPVHWPSRLKIRILRP